MFFQVFKVSPWVSFLTFFFFCQIAVAQRLQVQFQVGMNASEAFIEDNGQLNRETATFYDTINNIQLGLAVNAQIFKNFHLRLDGNYRAYRTFFETEEQLGLGKRYILGNLYSEKFNVSLLPEYRLHLSKSGRVQVPVYAFAGPVLSFEKEKNYADAYLIENGSMLIRSEIKPKVQSGWCFGAGVNPKWRRWGLLAEFRYTRFAYSNEDLPVGKMAYEHFTFMTGITIDLVK